MLNDYGKPTVKNDAARGKRREQHLTVKPRQIICLSVAFLIPQLAGAKLPLPNDSFGKMGGILDFCASVDAQGAPKYQERKKLIAEDTSEKEVADARKTQE